MTNSSPSTSSFRPYSAQSTAATASFPRPSLPHARSSQPFHLPDVDASFFSRPPKRRTHTADVDPQQPLYAQQHTDHQHLTVHSLPLSHFTSASSASSSSTSSYSPLSLCSSVSSVSTSSSGAAERGDSQPYHPSDSFDLHHDMDEDHSRTPYYTTNSNHSKPPLPPTSSSSSHPRHNPSPHKAVSQPPQAIVHHAAEAFIPYPPPSTSHYPLPITVSIPAPSGNWKESPHPPPPRRRDPPTSVVVADFPPPHVVAAAAAVGGDGAVGFLEGSAVSKKKKQRSLRRCMDREKHSKAEQKRRGEMKALFDQLQDISSCVYKDRIHILTLAIQTIQQQQATITALQGKVKVEGQKVKTEGIGDASKSASSPSSTTSSSSPSSPSSSPTPNSAAQLLRAPDAPSSVVDLTTVKRENDAEAAAPIKKQRTTPAVSSSSSSPFQPRDVVDLSQASSKVDHAGTSASYDPSTLAAFAGGSSSMPSGGGGGGGVEYPTRDYVYLMDDAVYADAHGTQGGGGGGGVVTQSVSSTSSYPVLYMSSAPFPFQPAQEWWPTTDSGGRKQ